MYYLQASTSHIAGRPASAWLDCGRSAGGGARADTYQITLRVTATIEPAAESRTRVSAALVAFARDRGMSGDGLPCASNGELEQQTLAAVAARLVR